MQWEFYLGFVLASILLCIVPGPDMLLIMGNSVVYGKRQGYLTALGVNVGAYIHLVVAITGLTALIVTSSWAFLTVKLLGALYLVYLGISILLKPGSIKSQSRVLKSAGQHNCFWHGFMSDVLNPKVALFYLTILPQFISANSANPFIELILLGVTLNIIGLTTNLLTVMLSSALSQKIQSNSLFTRFLRQSVAVLFIGLGIKLANEKL